MTHHEDYDQETIAQIMSRAIVNNEEHTKIAGGFVRRYCPKCSGYMPEQIINVSQASKTKAQCPHCGRFFAVTDFTKKP